MPLPELLHCKASSSSFLCHAKVPKVPVLILGLDQLPVVDVKTASASVVAVFVGAIVLVIIGSDEPTAVSSRKI